jgi:PhnB protein
MQVQPYLFFDGRCDEAIEFYRTALKADVQRMMRFKDNPEPQNSNAAPGSENKVMHASIKVGETIVMLSDGRNEGRPKFEGFSLTLDAATTEEAQQLFTALCEGGKVQMPLTKTFFSPLFGMVQDKFGVSWMVITALPQ